MKLTEHLEYVIGLAERSAPHLEIKSSLLAMYEEVQGTEQAAAKAIKLAEEKPEGLAELRAAVMDMKKELESLKNKPQTTSPGGGITSAGQIRTGRRYEPPA